MKTQKNVTNILVNQANIARTIAYNAEVPGTPIHAPGDAAMNNGEVIIVEPNGQIIDNAAAPPRYFKFLLRRNDGEYMTSDVIDAENVTNYSLTAFAARAEKVAAWGYNPATTTGAISVTPGLYKLGIQLNYASGNNWGSNYLTHAVNVAPAAATQATIAYGITDNGIKNTGGKGNLLIERTNATVSVATSGGTIDVRNGSKYVLIRSTGADDAGSYNGGANWVTINDYIRFVTGGVAVTGGVYRVVGGATGAAPGAGVNVTIELDVPYQGASATWAAADVGIIAVAGLGNFGVRFTSVAPTFAPPAFGNEIIDFVISDGSDDSTSPLVVSTAANLGVGSYRTVRQMEDEFNSNSIAYTATPDVPFTYQSVATGNYNMYYLRWFTDTEGLTSNDRSYKELYLAANTVGGVGTSITNGGAVLSGVGSVLAAYVTAYGWTA